MQGSITAYNEHSKTGLIRSGDGELHIFARSNWVPHYDPVPGMKVTFDAGNPTPANQQALKVKPSEGVPVTVNKAASSNTLRLWGRDHVSG